MTSIAIADRTIGPGHPCWIVAELSGNAGQGFDKAVRLVYAAKEAGADACKVQCFTPDAMTLQSEAKPFRLTWAGQQTTLWELYSRTAMPLAWHSRLKALAESLDMIYFASVFDKKGVDFCEQLGMPAYKIASFELVDLPLIRAVAKTGKPLILSTGMADETEIYDAYWAAVTAGWPDDEGAPIALLKCTSAYPAPVESANLRTLEDNARARALGIVWGLSDHTLGIAVPVAAVALGATIVEKHLTLSRADGGPDAAFSLEPAEFKAMVEAVRVAEAALGRVRYGPTDSERDNLRFRRSLWAIRDIQAGETLGPDAIRSLRPAGGLSPSHLDEVLGRLAAVDIARGTPLAREMVQSDSS